MDIRKLQRAIVDGLEDVKAQDISVFNTEHLSPLFERVIVASGTSNRQTKALAASVRDAVREAGFPKPRTEGEENGEWIIVDCGAAVVHVMQPAIRTYYHLEEIWGDKPVRLKFGTTKPTMAQAEEEPAPAKKGKAKPDLGPSIRRASAAKTAIKAAEQEAREAKGKPARKPAAKKTVAKGAAGKSVPAKRSITKVVAGKPAAKKAPARSAPVKSAPARSTSARGAPAKKAAAKKSAPRK